MEMVKSVSLRDQPISLQAKKLSLRIKKKFFVINFAKGFFVVLFVLLVLVIQILPVRF